MPQHKKRGGGLKISLPRSKRSEEPTPTAHRRRSYLILAGIGGVALLTGWTWLTRPAEAPPPVDPVVRDQVVAAGVAILDDDPAVSGTPVPLTLEGTANESSWRVAYRADDLCYEVRVVVTGGIAQGVAPFGIVPCPPIDRLEARIGTEVDDEDERYDIAERFFAAFLGPDGTNLDRLTNVDHAAPLELYEEVELDTLTELSDGGLYAWVVGTSPEGAEITYVYRLEISEAIDGRLWVTRLQGGGNTGWPTTTTTEASFPTSTSTSTSIVPSSSPVGASATSTSLGVTSTTGPTVTPGD